MPPDDNITTGPVASPEPTPEAPEITTPDTSSQTTGSTSADMLSEAPEGSRDVVDTVLVKDDNPVRKGKKLDKIMEVLSKKSKISNDEVEKFLHVSDATATRYLSILEKEGKIKQEGKTGKFVFYSKI